MIMYQSNDKSIVFLNKFIYFTIESNKDSSLIFEYFFRDSEIKNKTEDQSSKEERRHVILTYKDIDNIILKLKENPIELKNFNKTIEAIMKKKKEKSLKLSDQVDIIKKNKEFVGNDHIGCLKCLTTLNLKKEQNNQVIVKALRDKTQESIELKKFLMVYKAEIAKISVKLSYQIRMR